jgi:L-asparaginase
MPKPVLVIYTGGTIGSKPKDPDPDSPQIVVGWDEFIASIPAVDRLGFGIDHVTLEPPLDSCNVGPVHWRFMVDNIEKDYDKYSGVVILHGTDSMVYTACALSQMLRNLSKPVVITGAQRSAMVDPVRNDAVQNFLTSCLIANPEHVGIPNIPEVVIFFGGYILRGNRAVKRDTAGYTAYESPNLSPLGEAGESIHIDPRLVRPAPVGRFNARKRLDTSVLPILIYPGIQETDQVKRQLEDPNVKAAVVLSYGSGNIPTKPEFLDVFREARSRGIVLANVSQCARGPVELGIYETSAALLEAGFVSGGDMTLEAAQTKLMTLLGDIETDDLDPEERQRVVERAFEINSAGEMSTSIYVTDFGDRSGGTLDSRAELPARGRIRAATVVGQFEPLRVGRALLRLRGVKIDADDREGFVEFRVFINLDPEAALDNTDPGFGGRYRKSVADIEGLMVFDVSHAFVTTVKPGDRVAITLVVDTAGSDVSWASAELAVFVDESG